MVTRHAPIHTPSRAIAAALAPSLQDIQAPIIIGHSLGAYVALALASGTFGLSPAAVLAIGPKVSWSAADLAAIGELAAETRANLCD